MARIIGNTTATPNPQPDWNQTDEKKADYIKNKPFGETYGDTATYNGELTEPNVIVEQVDGMTTYSVKVSDAVPTVADMEGKAITINLSVWGTDNIVTGVFPTDDFVVSDDGLIICDEGLLLIIPCDNYEYDGFRFPSKGMYVINMVLEEGGIIYKSYIKSVTISGYSGFKTNKKIDAKYLPKHLNFGEKESDTLFWDGNTEGLTAIAGYLYHISNIQPTLDDFSHGCEITAREGEDVVTFTDVQVVTEDSYFALVVNDVPAAVIGNIGLSSGTFFASTDNYYIESLTINGYKGFTEVVPLDSKYLPPLGTLASKDEVTMGELATDVQEALKKANSAMQSYEETDPTVPAWAKESDRPTYTADDVGAISLSQKGVAGGVAELGEDGKVPSTQLPDVEEEVLVYTKMTDFPKTGEAGKIYIASNTLQLYIWRNSSYITMASNGAYAHSQLTTGNPHNITLSDLYVEAKSTELNYVKGVTSNIQDQLDTITTNAEEWTFTLEDGTTVKKVVYVK
jgi:hypothetical protein